MEKTFEVTWRSWQSGESRSRIITGEQRLNWLLTSLKAQGNTEIMVEHVIAEAKS